MTQFEGLVTPVHYLHPDVCLCVRETIILPVYPQKFNLEPSRTNKFHLQNCFPKAVSLFRMSFQGFMSHYESRTSRRWADHWGVGSPWASSSLDLSQGLSWRSLTQPDAARPSWKSVAGNGSGGCIWLLGSFWFFMATLWSFMFFALFWDTCS